MRREGKMDERREGERKREKERKKMNVSEERFTLK